MRSHARIGLCLAPATAVAIAIVAAASGSGPRERVLSPELALSSAGGKARIVNESEGGAVIGAFGWIPGQTAKGHVRVENVGPGSTAVQLSVAKIRDLGIDGALLSRATTVRVLRDRPIVDERVTVFDGPLRKLRRVDVGTWRAGGTRAFRIWATLEPRTDGQDNAYQRAELSFDLAWSAEPDR